MILVEMAQNRENALCCGGGGDLEMVDSDLVSAVAARKIEMDLKAEMIVTACPQCERTMSAEVRAQKKRVRVLDITEMVWRAIERGEGRKKSIVPTSSRDSSICGARVPLRPSPPGDGLLAWSSLPRGQDGRRALGR